MIIAIDGPAASGKGTLAKRVADHFGFHCLDTGLLYRATARDMGLSGYRHDDMWAAVAAARGLHHETLDDPALRGSQAGEAASVVARIPQVRAALLAYQRMFAAKAPGAVLDGRDIGTVICPDAPIKIFVTASPEVRALRRFNELQGRGVAVTFEVVLADIRLRDERDQNRAAAPLKPASDAILLDTTNMNADEAFAEALKLVDQGASL